MAHPCGLAYLRENEAILVGKGEAAALGHVVEHPGSVLHAGEVQHLDGALALHEGEAAKVVVRRHAVLDGVQVLPGALDVPLSEGADCFSREGGRIGWTWRCFKK